MYDTLPVSPANESRGPWQGILVACNRYVVVAAAALAGIAAAAVPLQATRLGASPVAAASNRPNGCEFTQQEASWVQRALDGWDLVRRDFLKVDARQLPWIVLYDASCIWHFAATDPKLVVDAKPIKTRFTFAGDQLDVLAMPHRGTVLLPNRVEIPIEIKASTALYRSGRATFFVMSMPSVWRRKPYLDEYLQGVFSHELVHTLQLVNINRRLRQLIGTVDVPGRLNDDVIQARFQKEQGFARAMDRERELFYKATGASDKSHRNDLVRKALAIVRERHAKYFAGSNAVYHEIESLFLTMEGVGQWTAYRLTKARGQLGSSDADAMNLVREDRRYWSQDEGLALFLLIEAMVPNWQARMFDGLPPSPYTLLEDALKAESAPSKER